MKILYTLTFLFILIQHVYPSVGDLPGTIPLEFKRPPATDLIYNGKILLPHDAMKLHKAGVDLSKVNPKESDIWKNIAPETIDSDLDEIGLVSEDETNYVASVLSRIGNYRFSVYKETNSGKKFYTMMLSKKIHNILLRSAILRKLGYTVPAIKYIPKLRVKFGSSFEKENFINQMSSETLGDPARWIVENKENSKEVVVQDLIAYEPDNEIYNLALGYVPATVIKGRRVFNSLLIPYALTYIPETVNQFSWHCGVVVDNFLRLDYEDSNEFSTSYEDALWMLNRIEKLTEADFREVVKFGQFPAEVELLIIHKLIARRNALMKHFNIETEELSFDPKVSMGENLVDGKLQKENWEGYASRFAFGDVESPLSSSELFSYFKSKVISNGIYNLVNRFNKEVIPGTDVRKKLYERQMERAYEAFRDFILNGGSPKPVPVSVYAIPTYKGNLIASREIIAGSYLGTDNVVQLVDAIGANMSVGAYLGTDKVALPFFASGNVNAFVTRTYSHVRPIKSMKKALKESFKNILIPLHKRKIAHLLDDAIDENLVNDEIDVAERQEKLTKILGVFKEELEIGESLIITDTVGASLGINAGYKFEENFKAYLSGRAQQLVISRLHIHRKNEDTIQIYKDLGAVGGIKLSFSLNAYMPILTIGVEVKKGRSNTKFYSLDINENIEMNPDIFKNIEALRALLLKNSVEQVKKQSKPYKVRHDFNESSFSFSLLAAKRKDMKSRDFITVTHPEGAKKYFYRRMTGYRQGVDYQNTILDVINTLFQELTDTEDVSLSTQSDVNPGDTLYGRSFSRTVTYEGEVIKPSKEEYDADGQVTRSIVNVYHRWKGWEMSESKAKSILKEINNKYDSELYPPHLLNETKELQLYQVKLFISFYEQAIKSMVNMPRKQVIRIFKDYADEKNLRKKDRSNKREEVEMDDLIEKAYRSFFRKRKKYIKWLKRNDLSEISYYASKMVSVVEASLKVQGMLKLAGGKKGVYIYSRMEGFRSGDEAGDQPFVSSSLGQIGAKDFKGPLFDMQGNTGMTESEFFGFWIQGRL